jgi:hypothetical protein
VAPTNVDDAKLLEWKERLPRRPHTFLDNFYGTCRGCPPEVNFANYLMDLRLYGATTREYRENRGEMVAGSYEITGWRPVAKEPRQQHDS